MNELYPNTALEFEEWFNSEKACRDYLFKLRWPQGFHCPKCRCSEAWWTNRELYRCSKCDFQISLTAGTIFHDTKKPLQMWFNAIWYTVNQKNGVSALGLQRALGLGSYHTAWTWMHKLRIAMVRPGRDCLTGTIEADEIYIGGEKSGKRGRGAEGKALVFIAAQVINNHIGRIRLCQIDDASAISLEAAIQKTIKPGAIVHTDAWSGYNNIQNLGYSHQVVRKDTSVGDNLLPKANRVASLLKRWLLGTHQGAVRPSHLDYYLDEFTFRFNRRNSKSRGQLFYRLVQQAVMIDPIYGYNIKGN